MAAAGSIWKHLEASGEHLGSIWKHQRGITSRHLETSRQHVETSRGICRHLGDIRRHLGDTYLEASGGICRLLEASGTHIRRHLGVIWRHLRIIWEPSRSHLGGIWDASGGQGAVAWIWEEFDRKSTEFHRKTIELPHNLKDFFPKPSNYEGFGRGATLKCDTIAHFFKI